LINLYGATADKTIQEYSPQVQCAPGVNITADQALADFNKTEGSQGLMYCFCKSYFLSKASGNYVFSDGVQHCNPWVQMYLLTNALVYAVPILISACNYIAKTILRYMATLEKRHYVPQMTYSMAINVMAISFLNLGVMVLLVNISISQHVPIPIL
jgi:hypothetical protein